jgi:hypothetical protein
MELFVGGRGDVIRIPDTENKKLPFASFHPLTHHPSQPSTPTIKTIIIINTHQDYQHPSYPSHQFTGHQAPPHFIPNSHTARGFHSPSCLAYYSSSADRVDFASGEEAIDLSQDFSL